MNTPNASARSPMVAVILSLAATGLGQVYCRRIVRGLGLFLGSLLFTPVIVTAALLPPTTVVLVGLIVVLLLVLGVYKLSRYWTPSASPAAARMTRSRRTTTIRWCMLCSSWWG